MKYILLVALMFIVGCSNESSEYSSFIKANIGNQRLYCSGRFLMMEKFTSPKATAPDIYLLDSQDCNK